MLVGAVAFALLTAYVWRRRLSSAGSGLILCLVATGTWGLGYALELSSGTIGSIELWGDLKYLGILLLPPAWLTFVLQYTGQAKRLSGRAMVLLAIEPLVVLVLLAFDGTHDLIRYFPPGTVAANHPQASIGPLFWFHLVYTSVVLWIAFGLLVARLVRVSRIYRRQSAILFVAAVLPYLANVLYNFDVGPFGRIDLTPFLFVGTCAVLVWGAFRFKLLELRPVARGLIFATISDGVLVLDHLGRVIDANPAAERLLGQPIASAIGQPVERLLPRWAPHLADPTAWDHGLRRAIEVDLEGRTYELAVSPLPDLQGEYAGQLLVARDITDRKWAEEDLRTTLERLRTVDEQRQSLLARLVDAEEEERRRIAASVSGRTLQSVSTALVRLRAFSLLMEEDERSELLNDIALPLARGLDDLRGLLVELRQPVFDRSGLVAALDDYAEPIRQTGAEVEVKARLGKELSEQARVNAFRIAQEALTNVRSHALASMVTIGVEESGEGLLLRIEDNGVGFDQGDTEDAPGLASMRRRAEDAGGWLRLESAPGEGTTVECWLPI
jgi:PAS domain S-box-containing protein